MASKIKFTCKHCNKAYSRESTLAVHVCEPKRRFQARTEPYARIGLITYQRFTELAMRAKKVPDWDDFDSCSFYTSFTAYGRYVATSNLVAPEKYTDWLLTNSVRIEKWPKDSTYAKFIAEFVRKEPVDGAVARSIETMLQWGEKHLVDIENYFKISSMSEFYNHIRSGRVSPWVLYGTTQGKQALLNLDEDLLQKLFPIIEPEYWNRKISQSPEDVEWLQSIFNRYRF